MSYGPGLEVNCMFYSGSTPSSRLYNNFSERTLSVGALYTNLQHDVIHEGVNFCGFLQLCVTITDMIVVHGSDFYFSVCPLQIQRRCCRYFTLKKIHNFQC